MRKAIIYDTNYLPLGFGDLKDKELFCSNEELYMKIAEQDLRKFGITHVNSINIENACLKFFNDDEMINRVHRNILYDEVSYSEKTYPYFEVEVRRNDGSAIEINSAEF